MAEIVIINYQGTSIWRPWLKDIMSKTCANIIHLLLLTCPDETASTTSKGRSFEPIFNDTVVCHLYFAVQHPILMNGTKDTQLIPIFPYRPAAMIPVIKANTFPTSCQDCLLTPWYAKGRVNWPWKEYTNKPYIKYAVQISSWAQIYCGMVIGK